jgi:hypothetical protein
MQLPPDTDQPMARKRRLEDWCSESNAKRQQILDRTTVRDNARAHIGDHHNYHGPVYQNATSVAPLIEGTERKITDALEFEGMDMRRATVKLPPGNTCQWFFESPEYKEWRNVSMFAEHHGFLWIRGKPGAGKSTLMRLAVKHADQDFPNDLRTSFFFNAKGTLLEKSVEGMYRTLLYQLLIQCPELEKLFHKRSWNHTTWPVGTLEEHFRDCVLQLGARKLTCHVDALDECEESDVRGLIEFFEDLGSMAVSAGVQMHICFASRHYPRISISRCVDLVLDSRKGHQEDIATYVRNNLKVSECALRVQFAEDIRRRARDVFLWVVLVVRLLNKESDQGNSHHLRAQLDTIPRGLHDLFENAILERGTDDSRYFLPIMLWMLFATRPLSSPELYHAVLYARNDIAGAVVLGHTPDPSHIERFILNTSKGLVEITASKKGFVTDTISQVHFVHETVREYLLNGGISRLESSFCNNPIGMSHDFLKSRCADYMSFTASSIQQVEKLMCCEVNTLERRQVLTNNMFPFLRYTAGVAGNYVKSGGAVSHAELAQAHGVSQVSFLETFPLDLVIKLSNLAIGADNEEYYPSATKPYIFALLNAPRLLQLELDRFDGGGEHRSRVDAGAVSTAGRGNELNSVQGIHGLPLHAAISKNNFSNVKLLLEHGSGENYLGLGLKIAAEKNCDLEIVELLFQYGAGVTSRFAREALHLAAARRSKVGMVRLLLEHGADVNAQGEEYGPLQTACYAGNLEVVKYLVEHGANVNAKGVKGGYGTALQAARSHTLFSGKQEIVHYLLGHGAEDENDNSEIWRMDCRMAFLSSWEGFENDYLDRRYDSKLFLRVRRGL